MLWTFHRLDGQGRGTGPVVRGGVPDVSGASWGRCILVRVSGASLGYWFLLWLCLLVRTEEQFSTNIIGVKGFPLPFFEGGISGGLARRGPLPATGAGNPHPLYPPLPPYRSTGQAQGLQGRGGEKNRGPRGCAAPTWASSSVLGRREGMDSRSESGMTGEKVVAGYGGTRRVGRCGPPPRPRATTRDCPYGGGAPPLDPRI